MALPQNTYTLEQFIKSGRSVALTYPSTSFMNQVSGGTWVGVWNVINDYMEELENACVTVKLTDQEHRKYRYRPKLLALDIYGNAELYFVILLLNHIIDMKEFDMQSIKMIDKNTMNSLMTQIFNSERKAIASYNAKDQII